MNYVRYKTGTYDKFKKLPVKDSNTLYFITDVKKLYKGSIDITSCITFVTIFDTETLNNMVEGKLYVQTTSNEIRVKYNDDIIIITPGYTDSVDTDDTTKLVTLGVVKKLIENISIDDEFTPDSKHAQSGVAVKQALDIGKKYTDTSVQEFDKKQRDYVDAHLQLKVDKVPGKMLSSNDYTDEMKNKTNTALQPSDVEQSVVETSDKPISSSAVKKAIDDIKGKDGFSPLVEITEVESGTQVDITDVEGKKSFTVEDGIPGVYYGTEEPKDPNHPIWVDIDDEYPTGKDGFSPILTPVELPDGVRVDILDVEGTKSFELSNGTDGSKGDDGFSPILTSTETAEGVQVNIVDAEGEKSFTLHNGADGRDGQDGTDGEDGFSPLVETTPTEDGTQVDITDKIGVKTFTIKNGENGKDGKIGRDGEPGIYYGTEKPTSENHPIWIDISGDDTVEDLDEVSY